MCVCKCFLIERNRENVCIYILYISHIDSPFAVLILWVFAREAERKRIRMWDLFNENHPQFSLNENSTLGSD